MKINKLVLYIISLLFCQTVNSQSYVEIWEGVETMKNVHTKLYVYPANKDCDTHTAVIICPGGSYAHMCGMSAEGKKTAEWFSKQGITAFILRYRTAGRGYHHPAMIEDFQRAMQFVRENSTNYGIDPDKIGAIGFSAGGHLVTMGNECSGEDYLKSLGISTSVDLCPNWVAAIYPVVSMQDSIAHRWSRRSLLGSHYTKAMQDKLSTDLNVNETMCPMYIQASDNDHKVDVRNSISLVNSLINNNVSCHFEHLKSGGHGYGMKDNKFARKSKWREKLYEWLAEINII